MALTEPFWRSKKLDEMTKDEWESLCDGCGRCCLLKRFNPDGSLYYTDVHCKMLDPDTIRCKDYENRQKHVPKCIQHTPSNIPSIYWFLPSTCGYRLVYEGKDLEWWHPLKSGDPKTVEEAGISVKGTVVSEMIDGRLRWEDEIEGRRWPYESDKRKPE